LNFGVPDRVGESRVRPRRSLRQTRASQENEVAKLIFELVKYIIQLEYLYRKKHRHIRSYLGKHMVVKWNILQKDSYSKGCQRVLTQILESPCGDQNP